MLRVSVIGSGNWGSTIAKIVGSTVVKSDCYCHEIRMWVFEEMVEGKKLTDIINTSHENVRYLPGVQLPENVKAIPDVVEAAKDADILIFVIPHQFLKKTLTQLKPGVKSTAWGLSLMKGLAENDKGGINLLTDVIRKELGIQCAVLMGANLASEVSQELYCEATVACSDSLMAVKFKELFQTDYFRIVTIDDEVGTELCGALKNIVAVGAGLIEGLGYGDNTKAAVIRLGFMEMKKFIYQFFGERHIKEGTFLESCGVADLITTCYGGRNKQIGHGLATSKEPLDVLEKKLLRGQSAQGPLTAAEVYGMLVTNSLCNEYPLFCMIHRIAQREVPALQFLASLQNHPEHR